MHFFRFLVRPTEENEEHGEVGGAYANCWVRDGNLETADQVIRRSLKDWGWKIEETDAFYPTSLEDSLEPEVALKHYQEAEEDGLSVVLHKWPVDGEDEE